MNEAELPLEESPPPIKSPLAPPAPLLPIGGPAASKQPPATTQLARPFSPPAEVQPPPEPSLWPLITVVLLGLFCFASSVGGVLLGIGWLQQRLVAQTGPLDPRQIPNAPPRRANPPIPAGEQIVRLPPPVVAEAPLPPPNPAQPPEQAEIERQFAEAVRQAREQVARNFAPPKPEPVKLQPFAPLDKPAVDLPRLTFGPNDVTPLGNEARGDELFQDIAPSGGWLVGMRAVKGSPWDGAIVSLQPIYQVGGKYQLGQPCGSGEQATSQQQFLAKSGYAVGTIEMRAGLILNAFRLQFCLVDGQRLNMADTYWSDWYGAEGGGPEPLSGEGAPLVGIAGANVPHAEIIAIQALRARPGPDANGLSP